MRRSTGNGTVGTWQTTSSMAIGREDFLGVAYNGYLYAFGGTPDVDVTQLSSVEYAPINVNGTVGTWRTTVSMDVDRESHGGVSITELFM